MTLVTIVHDATHSNIGRLPPGPAAGYTTGSGGIAWTEQDWAHHPGAVRIDQDPNASDPTADVLDVEQGAASPADCPAWARRALADFQAARRPGQRRPAIYASSSSLPAVADALNAGGVTGGVGLWVANWSWSPAEAQAAVRNAAGPFPVIAVQYANEGAYDTSVFSQAWLQEVSVTTPPAKTPPPPGQWSDPNHWKWAQVTVAGVGMDGKMHAFALQAGQWVKIL